MESKTIRIRTSEYLAELLRLYRVGRGQSFSWAELSREFGWSRTKVSRIYNKEAMLDMRDAVQIYRANKQANLPQPGTGLPGYNGPKSVFDAMGIDAETGLDLEHILELYPTANRESKQAVLRALLGDEEDEEGDPKLATQAS